MATHAHTPATVPGRIQRLAAILLLAAICPARGQIVVGGKEFVRSPGETGARGEWVLYERGAPRDEGARRWLTRRVLAELDPATRAESLARVPGVSKTSIRGNYAVVEFAGDPAAALAGAAQLRRVPGVRSAEPMLARQLQRRAAPDDPLFAYSPSNPGYQWHLRNTGQNGATAGIDLNVVDTWDSYRGAGIRIAIVDDGLEMSHPDLAPNIDPAGGYDFNDADPDPSPGPDDFHGTSCAGVAAARGNNAIGVSGVAPDATLVGVRLIAEPTTDEEEADAIAFDKTRIAIKSNSWGPYDGGFGAYGLGPLSLAALEDAATTGRDGKGTIFLWAAGNGNYSGDDSNYDGMTASPHAIAVSAINDKGRQAWYSEPGANILVCAPSNGGKQGITTTDRAGAEGYNSGESFPDTPDYTDPDYTDAFGGTSSATPAVAGAVALMLQANPALALRDVQEILVRTSTKNDEFEGGWVTNGAGFHFHHNYGAGLVDAAAATGLAATWSNLPARQSHAVAATEIDAPIPDFDEESVTRTFTVPEENSLRLEHVTAHVKVTHARRGNLEYRLTSPSGVTARLARARYNDTGADLDWTFMTTHFWGERSQGEWKLQVIDRSIDDTGTLDDATLTFYGTPPTGGLPLPVITSGLVVVGREGAELEHRMSASNFPTAFNAFGLPLGLSIDPATGLISGTPLGAGPHSVILGATNASGSISEFALFYILPANPALSEAVEQPASLQIVPFGFGDFFAQSTVTHDGVDAAQSAPVDDEEYSGMEFTVVGPAEISFLWKVSSEKNYDYLVLAVDGYVRDSITGEVDWTEAVTHVGPGSHNVDLYYLKDEGVARGQDAGWVDAMVITPTSEPPAVTADVIQAYQNVYFRHQIEATNAPATFSADLLPPGLSLHEETGLLYGSIPSTGSYPVTIHATNDFGTGTATITIDVGTIPQGLADSLDSPSLDVATTGNLGWVPQRTYSRDGDDAARSGPIGDAGQSVMSTQIVGPGKLTFYWGVSSERDYDFLRLFIDDVERDAISGEVGWTRKTYMLPDGIHTLRWVYAKDEFVASGLDSGFVDQLELHHDHDGDGFYADEESHFGTSDDDATQMPRRTISLSASGATLDFPSVPGNSYKIEYSDDLKTWTPFLLTATGPSSSWLDPNASSKPRRFYRVEIP